MTSSVSAASSARNTRIGTVHQNQSAGEVCTATVMPSARPIA